MGLALFIALEAGIFAPQAINAATDGQLTVNPDTGLAISGFDPVSYFTDGKALSGRPEFELNKDGAVCGSATRATAGPLNNIQKSTRRGSAAMILWRSAVTVRSAGTRCSGPSSVKGSTSFYSEKTRLAFLADPGRIIATAERKWPDVSRALGE